MPTLMLLSTWHATDRNLLAKLACLFFFTTCYILPKIESKTPVKGIVTSAVTTMLAMNLGMSLWLSHDILMSLIQKNNPEVLSRHGNV